MEELNCPRYLGVDLNSDRGMKVEWKQILDKDRRDARALKKRKLTTEAKMVRHNGRVVLGLLYDSETRQVKAGLR